MISENDDSEGLGFVFCLLLRYSRWRYRCRRRRRRCSLDPCLLPTGTIISAAAVSGDIVIGGTAIRPEFTVSVPPNTFLTGNSARLGHDFDETLQVVNSGWIRPLEITMRRDGVDFIHFNYSGVTGQLTIPGQHVTGNFTIHGTAIQRIAAPVLLPGTPRPGGFIANWQSVSGSVEYFLDVSTNSSFNGFVPGYNNRSVGNVTSFEVLSLEGNRTYYYRVRASASPNNTSLNSDPPQSVMALTSPVLEVTPTRFNLTAGLDELTINVESGGYWRVASDRSWARPSITTGIGNRSFTIHIDTNPDPYEREATITVELLGVKREIKIVQEGSAQVSIAFYYHDTFVKELEGYHISNTIEVLNNAKIAFLDVHGVNLRYRPGRYVPPNSLPMDGCYAGYANPCNFLCFTSGPTPIECKDGITNLGVFRYGIMDTDHSRIGVLLCRAYLRAGFTRIGGIALPEGRANMNDFVQHAHTRNTRLLQHELSHNFGVRDHSGSIYISRCTPDEDCLMNGDFFNNHEYDRTDIWCRRHREEFNASLHR